MKGLFKQSPPFQSFDKSFHDESNDRSIDRLPSIIKLPIAPAMFEASLRSASSPAKLTNQQGNNQSINQSSNPTNNQLNDQTNNPSNNQSNKDFDYSRSNNQSNDRLIDRLNDRLYHPYNKFTPTILPKLKNCQSTNGINEINIDCVAELLMNQMKLNELEFDRLLIIDCRYQYEYAGGHIVGAINAPHHSEIKSAVFSTLKSNELNDRTLIILHCELSRNRGPRGLKHLRRIDREMNGLENFPKLFLPQIYLMTGGYREFYSKYSHLCVPQAYVPMDDPAFTTQLKEVRRNARSLNSLSQPLHLRASISPTLQAALCFTPLTRARSAISSAEMASFQLGEIPELTPATTPSPSSTPSTPILLSSFSFDSLDSGATSASPSPTLLE